MSSRVTPLDKRIAAHASHLRICSGGVPLSKRAVAKHLGITYQSYSEMENGNVSFRVSTLVKLAQLYNVGLDYFID